MEDYAETDFELAGFDADRPGQFSLGSGDVVILRLCHSKSRALHLAYRLSRNVERWTTLYFDSRQPALALFEWHLSPEQGREARRILRPLRVRETAHRDIFEGDGPHGSDAGPAGSS